jgi:tetratricopeptide (TPR) repeat protein
MRVKVLSFKIIALLLPFVALGLLEVSLRIFDYGHDMSLFIADPADNRYLVLNPDASRRYFSNQENATTGNAELFKRQKDPGTLRIFVLGESTTIGYPYFHNGSFHRWLQYRLMHTFPDRNLEIINLSLTAVNSYTVLGFARELADYSPDAVLIYTGHNEYYGALGVGSTDRIGGNVHLVRAVLWLRQFRVMQLMTNTCEGIAGMFARPQDVAGKTRMEVMVGDQRIAYGSTLFKRGIDQFRTNMSATLSFLSKRHIPVFISNLVSNEKDLPPFIGAPARQAFDEGRQAYDKGDYSMAKASFDKARELDELRFRAPDEINTVIGELSHDYDNVHLVDARSAFEAASPHGIIGNELILEHVHPNLRGYALLSDVFYTEMKKDGLFSVPASAEMPFPQLLASMPVTRVDSLTGVYKILNLKSKWPFTGGLVKDSLRTTSEEEELAFNIAFRHMPWEQAMSNLYDYYIKEQDLGAAGTVMEGLVLEHPTEEAYYEKTANVYGKLKDFDKAIFYFKKSFALSPSFDKAKYIFVMDLTMDRPLDALPFLDYAVDNNTSGANLAGVKAFTEQVIHLQKISESDTGNVTVLNQIADAYAKMGNKEGAEKYYAKVLKINATTVKKDAR